MKKKKKIKVTMKNIIMKVDCLCEVNKIKMQQEGNFFATQIKGEEQGEERVQQAQQQQEKNTLRHLLTAFNSYDKQEKGLIKRSQVVEILTGLSIPHQYVAEYHQMSLPQFSDLVSFDQFLFIFILSQNTSLVINDKYRLCREVDERLIEFLRLLTSYRKKCQRLGNYKEAKNSKRKIEEIRERQLDRRNKYLKQLYQQQLSEVQLAQNTKFEEFCKKWDQFMNDYQATATQLTRKVREKQISQLNEYQQRTKQELASKMHFSKHFLQLQLRERNLVKVQDYQRAAQAQADIEELRARELRQKQLADQQVLELRIRSFRKNQQAAISTLLQKIQKDRNDHLKQRQSETDKLMVRKKAQLTELDHRYGETLKRIHEALHNLGLDSDRNKQKK